MPDLRFAFLIRFFFTAMGMAILATILPLKNPWQMSNIVRILHPPLHFDFYPFGLGWSFRMSDLATVILLGTGFLLPLLLRPSARRAFAALRTNKTIFFSAVLAFEVFAFTLIPVSNDSIYDTKSVVLFLLLGLLALLYLSIGLGSVITQGAAATAVLRFAGLTRRMIFESPARSFVLALFLLNFALTNAFSLFLFEHIPHVHDSIAQLFQAKIFASGNLTAPEPPHKEFFSYMHMIADGRWYSQYPPGHPFLLTLGVLIGIPWIVNPLLGSLTIVVLYVLGKELFGERTGRLSAILGLLSPFLLFMSSGFMNHTSAMLFFLVFVLFLVRALRSGTIRHGLFAGAALGMVVNIRPYSAAPLALLFLLYGLVRVAQQPRDLWRTTLAFILSLIAFTGILLLYNDLTNGHPFLFGFEVLYGPNVLPGFGHAAWGVPHNVARGLLQTLNNLNGLNKYLFEWPAPSLLFVFLLFALKEYTLWDLLFAGTFAAVVIAYFFYWFQDWCFGPRFLYEPSALLIILTARGIERLPALAGILRTSWSLRDVRHATFAVLLFLFGFGAIANLPRHLEHYGNSYWDVDRSVRTAVEQQGITKAVVFTRTNFGAAFPANDPFLKGDVIFARDFGSGYEKLMEEFPGYSGYIAVGADIQPLKLE